MEVLVTLEHRFTRNRDGAVWTQTGYTHSFWRRYLSVFDQVRVAARVDETPEAPSGWRRADGDGVSFVALPHYLGPMQYLMQLGRLRGTIRGSVEPADAIILRVGSPIAAALEPLLHKTGHPYGVEVVGDPFDTFAPGAMKHPLRAFCRWWFSRELRRQSACACAAAYVTQSALQRRYPPAPDAFSTHYSSIELKDAAIRPGPRPVMRGPRRLTLVSVGTMAQLYKAPDVLIDAVGDCIHDGLDLELALVGDGQYRSDLEARVHRLGLRDRVRFLGQLTAGDDVQHQLDQADLFVLPSRQEGLPRAMIEAMARALPCIGSTVGGIPELLPAEDLVPPNDAAALARKIGEVAADPERMERMSARNLGRAREYSEEALRERRTAFYRYLMEQTQAWARARSAK